MSEFIHIVFIDKNMWKKATR